MDCDGYFQLTSIALMKFEWPENSVVCYEIVLITIEAGLFPLWYQQSQMYI